jgi:hypothetical protein
VRCASTGAERRGWRAPQLLQTWSRSRGQSYTSRPAALWLQVINAKRKKGAQILVIKGVPTDDPETAKLNGKSPPRSHVPMFPCSHPAL